MTFPKGQWTTENEKRYIALGTKDEIREWMRENRISQSRVFTVSPRSPYGGLRGLAGAFEVVTFPGWAKASASLIEATEQDICIIRATQPLPERTDT